MPGGGDRRRAGSVFPASPYGDVRGTPNITAADEERPEEDASERQPEAQPPDHLGVDSGPPSSAERLGQRLLDGRPRLACSPDDDGEPSRRQDGETERGQAYRRCEVALDGGQQRRGGEPEEGNEWQLV